MEEVFTGEEKEVNYKAKSAGGGAVDRHLGDTDPGLMPPLICCVTLDKSVTSGGLRVPIGSKGEGCMCLNPEPSSPHIW